MIIKNMVNINMLNNELFIDTSETKSRTDDVEQ